MDLRQHHRPASHNQLLSCDIVTVMEEGKSNRSTWKFGRILEVHPGNDGFVRGATVEVASSTGERKLLRRPSQKLFPLEVREVGGKPEANTWQREESRGGVPLSQERLEDEKSISFLKNKRTPFKGKLIERGRLSFVFF